MGGITDAFNGSLLIIVAALIIMVIALMIICIATVIDIKRLKKRYEVFTGSRRRPEHNLESQLSQIHETNEKLEEKYGLMCDIIKDMDKNMEKCIQKVGVIRYNPFDEVGGNLCYAVAILDNENNGVVLNGIHSRTGSFTYAKPIEFGVSEYVLSVEEKQALEAALVSGHSSKTRHEEIEELQTYRKHVYSRANRSSEESDESDEVMEGQMSVDDILAAAMASICNPEIGGSDFRDTKTAGTSL
ncbi:DUF4446 family protein [Anaerotignum faecicola]|nr:DUF4446 family protein [Anaerotignum faecicola]